MRVVQREGAWPSLRTCSGSAQRSRRHRFSDARGRQGHALRLASRLGSRCPKSVLAGARERERERESATERGMMHGGSCARLMCQHVFLVPHFQKPFYTLRIWHHVGLVLDLISTLFRPYFDPISAAFGTLVRPHFDLASTLCGPYVGHSSTQVRTYFSVSGPISTLFRTSFDLMSTLFRS